MRRISLWALSTLSAVVLLFGYHTSTAGPTALTSTPATTGSYSSSASSASGTASGSASSSGSAGAGGGSGDDTTPSESPGTTGSSSPSSSASPTAGTPTSTTVAGSVAQTRWGPVQVQLTVSGSRVTVASVLQYPQGNPRDAEINQRALPILTQETVDAQSASIDMVSGATVTSDGYLESLQSALDRAGL